ncbi:hypothetical protein [Chitinimonas taiwanensis]|uniref:SIR2-like domain-containing protein n=1 Tax=Chitinimonas taiwanensis DSM 18899 TaxID=1121279 RepID=A0A1K2HJJ9_9NEIS|nr:hypothetical protein [Chitinimonas taiwanensis]SFZ76943.1 hypothetical protein SAMN02745887_02161 [Chitinimonas taiwanensis DSM 18899]
MSSLILLGAGASFGSGNVHPSAPPLGTGPDGLFARLEAAGGEAASLPESLKELFRSDFEKGMAEYYEYSGGNVMRFQREVASCLAQFTPGDSNAYVRLLQAVGGRRVVYASLNYDLLIELSAASLGLGTCYGLDFSESHINVLKIHGSSNFWPSLTLKGCTFARNQVDVEAPIQPLDQAATLHRCANEDSLSPAIAMYAEGKAVKVSPSYVQHQQTLWRHAVSMATRVFVVGVKVHNVDVHIWGELAKSKAPLTYFGRSPDRYQFEEWKANCGKKNAYFFEKTFQECIEVIRGRLLRK